MLKGAELKVFNTECNIFDERVVSRIWKKKKTFKNDKENYVLLK